MKKKIGIFALLLVILPLLVLTGCGTTDSFTINVKSNWTGLPSNTGGGSAMGAGSYSEGKKVTLTATAKPNSRFIAWVYEDSLLITNDSTYTIKNDGADKAVTKSELTFKSNKKTKGTYTAIFDDNKIAYTMLSSWRVTNDLGVGGVEDSETSTLVTMSANLYISQGNIPSDVYTATSFELKNNVINHISSIKNILKLSAEEPQSLTVDFTLNEGMSQPFSKLMSAQIPFGTGTEDFVQSSDASYSYKTTYTSKGTYEIVFKFTMSGAEKYLVIEYSNLNVIF